VKDKKHSNSHNGRQYDPGRFGKSAEIRQIESAKAQHARSCRISKTKLTPEEQAQVERILAERTVPSNADRNDAIECVIADRKVREMVCHGGIVETV
jgi:hypothetical protein